MRTALDDAGEHANAARLKRGLLDVYTRTLEAEHRGTRCFRCHENLAVGLLHLGENAEAAVLLRTRLAALTRTIGADNEDTRTRTSGGTLSMHAREAPTHSRSRPPRHA